VSLEVQSLAILAGQEPLSVRPFRVPVRWSTARRSNVLLWLGP
jgi:hypothetical protein